MTDRIEDAAKAMWRRHWEGADEAPPEHWDAMPEVGRRYFTEMADAAAALAALKEDTQ